MGDGLVQHARRGGDFVIALLGRARHQLARRQILHGVGNAADFHQHGAPYQHGHDDGNEDRQQHRQQQAPAQAAELGAGRRMGLAAEACFQGRQLRQLRVELDELGFRLEHGIGGDRLVHLRHFHGFQHGLAIADQRRDGRIDEGAFGTRGRGAQRGQLRADGRVACLDLLLQCIEAGLGEAAIRPRQQLVHIAVHLLGLS
ncbi:hypothetical protein D3C81_1112490 [compost metagenome]